MKLNRIVLAVALGFGIAAPSIAEEITGSVKSVTNTSRSIAVEVAKKGVIVIKYDSATQFRNATSANDIIADEVVTVDFAQVGPENLAKSITKVIAPLPAGVTRMAATDLQQLIKKGGEAYLLVDSRPAGRYVQGHLPGAVSIPLNELEKDDGAKLLPADKAKTLIFYCGGLSCMLSPKSATIAVKLGYQDVRMFPEGEPGWKKLDYPTASSLSFVATGNIVLVDLRSPEKAASGHIPRAVNIPAAILRDSEKQFPEFHGAAIVFYSDKDEESIEALDWTREWEYKNATIFPGGTKAWQAAGNPLTTGAAPTKVSYVRKLAEGEVSIKEFTDAYKSASHVVIDARTADEFAKGHIAGALNIPAEEMAGRSTEVPSGKPVVIHCSTGTRAELAYDVLKERGVKARYLRASVEFGPADKVAIKE